MLRPWRLPRGIPCGFFVGDLDGTTVLPKGVPWFFYVGILLGFHDTFVEYNDSMGIPMLFPESKEAQYFDGGFRGDVFMGLPWGFHGEFDGGFHGASMDEKGPTKTSMGASMKIL